MKIVLLTALTFLTSTFIAAQSSLGIKGGLNISKATNIFPAPQERYAFHAGAVYRKPLTAKLFIQPELQYSSKGLSYDPSFGNSTLRFQYLAGPILIGFKVDEKLSILLGPEFDYLIKGVTWDDGHAFNFTQRYPRFDAGVDLGLTYRINKKWGAELRYNYGFNTLYYIDYLGDRHDEIKGGNRLFQAGMNYWFK